MISPRTARPAGRALVALVAICALAAGCGADDEAATGVTGDEMPIRTEGGNSGTAPTGDASESSPRTVALAEEICGYFNPRGIAEVVGEEVTEPRLRASTCAVRGADSASTALVSVEVTEGASVFTDMRENLRSVEDLPDIGDEAFYSDTTVVVRSGDIVMITTAQADGDDEGQVDPDDVIYMAELLASLVF